MVSWGSCASEEPATAYRWVVAHQNNIKNWEDMSLNEGLNAIVDGLAKKGINCRSGGAGVYLK